MSFAIQREHSCGQTDFLSKIVDNFWCFDFGSYVRSFLFPKIRLSLNEVGFITRFLTYSNAMKDVLSGKCECKTELLNLFASPRTA